MAVDQKRLDAALDDASRILRFSVFIATSILFCIALISFAVRMVLKLHRRPRHFSLDDLFLLFSLVLLIASTGLLYAKLDYFYLGAALSRNATLAEIAPESQIKELHATDLKAFFIAISILLWIATSFVKLAFLMLFRPVVQAVKGLAKYWVSALVMVGIGCIFWIVASVLIGINNSQNPIFDDKQLLFLALTYSGTAFDIFSYITTIYILVIIGSQETTLYSQKLAPRAFLCLTLLIAVLSVLRNLSFGSKIPLNEDSIWQMFWYYFEAGLTLLFVSLTTYRPMFGGSEEKPARREKRTQINFISDPELQAPKLSPTAPSFREWNAWWKAHEDDGSEKGSVGGGSGKSFHSRSASNLSAKSEGSLRKQMISSPEFVGGTSDWVMGRAV